MTRFDVKNEVAGLARWPVLCCLLMALAGAAQAQDERRITSPDGQLEFRIFVSQPGSGDLPQLAYQLRYRGRVAIATSFLGLSIHNQEPLLGENVGLTSSHSGEDGDGRWLIAEYMQNGSLGRRINVEVRVSNRAVAFRYVIPQTSALEEIMIEDEVTEFNILGAARPSSLRLPVAIQAGGAGWIEVSEIPTAGFPAMSLASAGPGVLSAHLTRSAGAQLVAFEGKTPLVCPWRVMTVGPDKEQAIQRAWAFGRFVAASGNAGPDLSGLADSLHCFSAQPLARKGNGRSSVRGRLADSSHPPATPVPICLGLLIRYTGFLRSP